ncbi:MAG: hypothetical protein MSA98_02830 [Spirochaetia bacterium]|nr:hypothetical protein [Spirochaetia bacterium]
MKSNLSKNFKLLLLSDFVSSFGSSMTNIVITMYVYTSTKDLLIASFFPFVNILLKLIVSLLLPKIKIKHTYKSLFILGELFAGGMILSFIWIKNLYFMLAVFSLFSGVFFLLELYRAEFLRIISTEQEIYARQSLSGIVNAFVNVGAPVLGGILIQTVGENVVFITDVVSYCIAAFLISFTDKIPVLQNQPQDSPAEKRIFSLKLTKHSAIYVGAVVVTFLGGATSLLTISYVLNFLQADEITYTVLMAVMAVGSMVGSGLINIPFVKEHTKIISSLCFFADGLLFFSVLLRPGVFFLAGIFFVSGILSSLVMTYYAISIYLSYSQEDVKNKIGLFNICIDGATSCSKPVGGFLQRKLGDIFSIALMGAVFIICSPINYLDKLVKEEEKLNSQSHE